MFYNNFLLLLFLCVYSSSSQFDWLFWLFENVQSSNEMNSIKRNKLKTVLESSILTGRFHKIFLWHVLWSQIFQGPNYGSEKNRFLLSASGP